MARAFGAGIIIAGVAVLLLWTLRRSGSGAYPLLYSQALLTLLLILLIVVFVQEVRAARGAAAPEGAEDAVEQPIFTAKAVAAIILTSAYVWGWLLVGHVLATVGFLFAALLLAGERRPAVILAFVIVLPLFIQFFFVWLLRIPLPSADWNVIGL